MSHKVKIESAQIHEAVEKDLGLDIGQAELRKGLKAAADELSRAEKNLKDIAAKARTDFEAADKRIEDESKQRDSALGDRVDGLSKDITARLSKLQMSFISPISGIYTTQAAADSATEPGEMAAVSGSPVEGDPFASFAGSILVRVEGSGDAVGSWSVATDTNGESLAREGTVALNRDTDDLCMWTDFSGAMAPMGSFLEDSLCSAEEARSNFKNLRGKIEDEAESRINTDEKLSIRISEAIEALEAYSDAADAAQSVELSSEYTSLFEEAKHALAAHTKQQAALNAAMQSGISKNTSAVQDVDRNLRAAEKYLQQKIAETEVRAQQQNDLLETRVTESVNSADALLGKRIDELSRATAKVDARHDAEIAEEGATRANEDKRIEAQLASAAKSLETLIVTTNSEQDVATEALAAQLRAESNAADAAHDKKLDQNKNAIEDEQYKREFEDKNIRSDIKYHEYENQRMFQMLMAMAEERFADLETKLFSWSTVPGDDDFSVDFYETGNVGNFVVGSLTKDIYVNLPEEGRVHDKPDPYAYTPELVHGDDGEYSVKGGLKSDMTQAFSKVAIEDWEPTMVRCDLEGETVKVKISETNGFQVTVRAKCMIDGKQGYVLPVSGGSVEFVYTAGEWKIR
jgi:hypothetical protein